jgi:hypothetical protein
MKQKASEEKAKRDDHLLRLIDNTTWQEADNFMVEDNVLKKIIDFDPAVFLSICEEKFVESWVLFLGGIPRQYAWRQC